eukprot:3112344-Amphidinium_carterae.1
MSKDHREGMSDHRVEPRHIMRMMQDDNITMFVLKLATSHILGMFEASSHETKRQCHRTTCNTSAADTWRM